jgi:hypothetical protein
MATSEAHKRKPKIAIHSMMDVKSHLAWSLFAVEEIRVHRPKQPKSF